MDNLNLDFSALLVALTLVTGVIWGLDTWLFRAKRQARGVTREPVAVEYSRSFFPVIFVVLILRSFIAEPFRIPSDSMMPTLLDGDFILVNKFTYGIRLPVLNNKIIALNEPARGDVVVFRHPGNPNSPNDDERGEHLIKRVIGLPGDRISYVDHVLTINGTRVESELEGPFGGRSRTRDYADSVVVHEPLPDGPRHEILLGKPPIFQFGPAGEWTVPQGQYLVMGDNRANSADGRVWGFLPEENLVGRAFFIWFSWNRVDNEPAFDRWFDSIP